MAWLLLVALAAICAVPFYYGARYGRRCEPRGVALLSAGMVFTLGMAVGGINIIAGS